MKIIILVLICLTLLSCKQKNENTESQNKEALIMQSINTKYPFELKNLTNDIQELFEVDWEKINWTLLVEISKKEKTKISSNADIDFCSAYALFNEAKNIHVDDLRETINTCQKLINKYELNTNSKIEFKNELERTLELVISKEKGVESLNVLDLNSLNLKEKKELAYSLSDKGGIENYRKSAIIYKELYNQAIEEYNKFFYLGNETISLFRSNQYSLALPNAHKLIEWEIEKGPSANPWVIDFVFTEMLLNNDSNKTEFINIWNKAKNHSIIKGNDNFPIAYTAQDEILSIAINLDLKPILADLIVIFDKNRPKETKSERVVDLVEKAKNAIQQGL